MIPLVSCRALAHDDLALIQPWYDEDGPDWPWLQRFWDDKTARVVTLGEPPVAVAWFRVIGPEAELVDIRVASEHRGQGFGCQLLTQALSGLDSGGVTAVHLEVRASNSVARRLYAGLGFEMTGERRDYYPSLGVSDRRENAILMSRKSPRGGEKS